MITAHNTTTGGVLAGLVTLVCCGGASANEGSGETGVGGAVFLQRENPHIRMLSEDVYIKLPECRVDTRFVFQNTGPAASALMIFPENGYLNTATEKFNREIRPRYTHFKYFRAWVDGRRVKTRRIVVEDRRYDLLDYKYWWAKRVRFGRGQTRVIVNHYRGGLGWGQFGNPERSFRYILGTGASWKGRILQARIICDAKGIGNKGVFRIEPAGYHRRGDRIAWEFRNLKPRKNMDLSFWWMDGFANVRVNGQHVIGKNGWKEEWGHHTAKREGQEVWAPARVAAGWLGARLTADRSGTVALQRGGTTATLAAGNRSMQSGNRRVYLNEPIRLAWSRDLPPGPRMIVPLRRLVRVLGGSSTFTRTGRLDIRLPNKIR